MKDNKIQSTNKFNQPDEIKIKLNQEKFESVTRIFLSSEKSKEIFCPNCGNLLNFGVEVEWMGPDAFLCTSCDKLLHMSLIHRALRDLGVK